MATNDADDAECAGDGGVERVVAAIEEVARRAVEFARASRRVDSAEQLELVETQAAEVGDQLFRVLLAYTPQRGVGEPAA